MGKALINHFQMLLAQVKATRLNNLSANTTFSAPRPKPARPGPKMQKIQYSKPLDEVNKAKKLLGVRSFVAVGEKTFEYFMEYEGEE